MVEELNKVDRGAQGNERRDTSWSQIKDFFYKNPTFGLTLLYIYVSGIGIVYSWALYRRFGINIFDYAEIADFLLAAFKNPITFLSPVPLILGVAVAVYTTRQTTQRAEQAVKEENQRTREANQRAREANIAAKKAPVEKPEEPKDVERHQGGRTVGIIALAVFLVVFLVFLYSFAGNTASSIKDGENQAVDVRYRASSDSADQVTKSGLELIGATQTVVFFYDVDDKHTLVIPQSQIVSIEVPE
jgi:hypothetical protein